jgi:paraquat-inducible protein B
LFAWVWVVPIAAAGIVLWLAWRSFSTRGPDIEITFRMVQGLQPEQSTVRHRDVTVGTVESVDLTRDMSQVVVRARMKRSVEPSLTDTARFYIVAPRVSVQGISGLNTLISGSYIEMVPGSGGRPRRHFVGLDEPPVLPPDTPGRSFTLRAANLGSLLRGSPISYRGTPVGEVAHYELTPDGQRVNVTAFIRSPHERLVHSETRFWNAGGFDVSVGAQGVRIRTNSWQQLLSGGIEFDTPPAALQGQPSAAGAVFPLYDDRQSALRTPRDPPLVCVADFSGNLRGIEAGTVVELQGTDVGDVTSAELRYDERLHTLITRVTLSIDPARVKIVGMPRPAAAAQDEVVTQWLDRLVAQGLRAQVLTPSFVTGLKIVTLDMTQDVRPARVKRVGQYLKLPSAPSTDITEVLRSLQSVLQHVDRATAGPELNHALKSLDDTLTRLDHLTQDVEPDLKSLITSLRETADAAQSTLASVQGMTGGTDSNGTDLAQLMRELAQAARSVRVLADYLERHPEALLRGRKGDDR